MRRIGVPDQSERAVVIDPKSWRGRALGPTLVYVALLTALVSGLGAPLVPTIARRYGVSLADAQWSLTGTQLVGAISAPVLGRLAGGPRRREAMLASMGLVLLGMLLAALSGSSFVVLLVGRVLQGCGLGLLPLVMGIARDHQVPEASRSTLATLSISSVVGVGLAYPLSAAAAEYLGFHSGFWIAGGLGLIGAVVAAVVVPPARHQQRQRVDMTGAVLFAVGVVALLIALGKGEQWGWVSPVLIAVAAAAVVVLTAWVWSELRISDPLTDLRLLRKRDPMLAYLTALLAGIGMYLLMSMVIRYMQTPASTGYGLGESAVIAGTALVPLSVCSFLTTRVTSRLARRVDPARILPVGMLIVIGALALFATARSQTWEVFVAMGVAGIGLGCSFAVMPAMIIGATPKMRTGSALALNQVLRTVGFAIGSALSATVLAAATSARSPFPADHGYTTGALIGIGFCALVAVLVAVLGTRRARTTPAEHGGTASVRARPTEPASR
jgi:predicted MFS family arabinose efflux permease